jgi:hypothetical protein
MFFKGQAHAGTPWAKDKEMMIIELKKREARGQRPPQQRHNSAALPIATGL